MRRRGLLGLALGLFTTVVTGVCLFQAWDWIWYEEVPWSSERFSPQAYYTLLEQGIVHRSGYSRWGSTVYGLRKVARLTGEPEGSVTLWYPDGLLALKGSRAGSGGVTTLWDPTGAIIAAFEWTVTGTTRPFYSVTHLDARSPRWMGEKVDPGAPWIRDGIPAEEWWAIVSADAVKTHPLARYAASRWGRTR